MFGISFSELLLVGLVALLVLGPERLPGAARTAGLWVGRLKRSFNAIKQEVEREIGADEIRRQLHNEHILSLEEEARKIMQPQQPPAQPAAQPGTQPEKPPASQPVMGAAPSPAPSADIGPAAPAESASVSPQPVHIEPAQPAPTPAPASTTAVQNAPSANDSTQPPRAP
ncbi:Sec-independent protein translocase protein TatB [Pseudomonas sp. LS-2]|uniref:Sec-independent protein translocase protein TatB n=1 Tax=Pseudomonas sp. LS-2 TaxID=2315859 RepID=UPI000E7085EA|nr:Sec-independent protein translocase protein TatB [Pseudomonas sp. LS-2]RJX76196.1 Sec-independent protein translocase subunit TatB [Pseudomonas sp. LS-2]